MINHLVNEDYARKVRRHRYVAIVTDNALHTCADCRVIFRFVQSSFWERTGESWIVAKVATSPSGDQ